MAKSFWDMEVTVCEVEINEKNKIVVKNCAKGDKNFVDIRKYFLNKEGEFQPTSKGIALPAECADEVSDIIKGAVNENTLPF